MHSYNKMPYKKVLLSNICSYLLKYFGNHVSLQYFIPPGKKSLDSREEIAKFPVSYARICRSNLIGTLKVVYARMSNFAVMLLESLDHLAGQSGYIIVVRYKNYGILRKVVIRLRTLKH